LNTQLDIIIKGCRDNDIHCQEQLYKLCYPEMIKICSRYASDLDGAGIIFNNAMLKVFKNIEKYKEEGRLMGWIKTIVVNCSIDFVKKGRDFTLQPVESAIDEVKIEEPDIVSNLTVKEIRQLIAELPKSTSVVFNLFVYEGYTHKQISTLLGISEGTSKWHVNDAKRILKNKLQNFFTNELNVNAAG
jgi:RNA polymerase sigma-70 factor, ECF subfamily